MDIPKFKAVRFGRCQRASMQCNTNCKTHASPVELMATMGHAQGVRTP